MYIMFLSSVNKENSSQFAWMCAKRITLAITDHHSCSGVDHLTEEPLKAHDTNATGMCSQFFGGLVLPSRTKVSTWACTPAKCVAEASMKRQSLLRESGLKSLTWSVMA